MQLLGIKTTKYKRTTFIVTPAKKDIISTSFPSRNIQSLSERKIKHINVKNAYYSRQSLIV